MATFQIASDLHLEFYNDNVDYDNILTCDDNTDYLILAGDICTPDIRLEKFFTRISPKYKLIFYIAGNHEFYGGDIYATRTIIKNICNRYNNIKFLDNDIYIIDDTVIIGTTLWSHIPKDKYSVIKNSINDTIRIINMTENRGFNCDDMNIIFANNKKWLQDTISKYEDNVVVVVTHHLPSFQMIHSSFKNSNINNAFASDLEDLMEDVDIWIAGHSHKSVNMMINNTLCITNPRGYPEEINSEFIKNYTFKL